MKKLLYSFMAAGAVAGLASCASDEPMMSGSNDGRVSISVEIPQFSTRAYGDTLNCNQLIYTVYDATGETVIFPDSAVNAFGAGVNSANITLQLVPGETYTLVCYAHNTGSQFSSYKEGNITVDYTKLTANDENHDAFYRALPITVDGQGDKKITLNRAFAQINFGTNDLNNPAVQKVIGNFEAKLNIASGLYNTLSCKDSTVSNSDDLATTLAVTNNFTQNSNFPVPGYGNLTSVYVLVGADAGQLLGEGTYVINNGATEVRNVNLASTPVRMNYRTNVYGAMLTTDLPVTVELRPAFETPTIQVWDGEESTTPAIDDEAKTITMSRPSDFEGFAKLVNEGNPYTGYTMNILTDMDFDNHPVTPIASGASRSGNAATGVSFEGMIDGQGHVLKNLTIDDSANSTVTAYINSVKGANAGVKNIQVENLNLTASSTSRQTGFIGLVSDGATVSNITITSGTVSGNDGVGAVVGRILGSGSVTDCTNGATVTGKTTNIGGIVGAAYYSTAAGMTISNCHNTGKVSGSSVTGGVVGLSAANVEKCTNTADITTTGGSTGGVIGAQQNAGSISNCDNKGNILISGAANGAYGAGGIVGWVRYNGATTDYPVKNIINVTGCTNSGNVITDLIGAGGIVGMYYNWGTVSGCTTTATQITSKSFVAGVVGSAQTDTAPGTEAFGPYNVVVKGNTSTTTLDQMSGANKALVIYVNNSNFTTVEDNITPEN